MTRKSGVAATVQTLSVKSLATHESLQSNNAMSFSASIKVDDTLRVDDTSDLSAYTLVDEIYYIYYDNFVSKFKLSKSFTSLLDTTIQQDYEFVQNPVLSLCENRTYKFIMKSSYNDLNDGSLTNKMDERFLIWTERNHSATLDIRIGSPQAVLGDPMNILYYVNDNTTPTTYTNYKISNNNSSELRFVPETNETLYYFSSLQLMQENILIFYLINF